jgi:energy-coupling factor transporter ATP-binding protein EcfA2
MELLRKATTLQEAYDLLDPDRPLEGKWLECFYAERPEEASIVSLIDELQWDSRQDDKTIFTGHRGSGKTTELARLEEALRPTHTVARFNVESLLNLGDVDYADLLVVLGLQVFQAARRSGIQLDERRLQDLVFWYATHVLEEDEKRKIGSEVGGELNAIIAKIIVKITTDAPKRQTIRAEAHANLSDLLERLNALLENLRQSAAARW